MNFWAIYNTSDGTLESIGTVMADPLPAGRGKVSLDHEPDFSKERWNPATLEFEPRPAAQPESVTVAATALDTDLGKMLAKLLEKQGVQVKVR